MSWLVALCAAGLAAPMVSATAQDHTMSGALPMVFVSAIKLTNQSPAVEWKGQIFSLVNLSSIQFQLDQSTEHLTAEIKAGVTTFDEVDYDINVPVFADTGELLGIARGVCHVQRPWLGRVLTSAQTISLDFGVSLDYARAATFMVGVSKRKVQTPDDWKK